MKLYLARVNKNAMVSLHDDHAWAKPWMHPEEIVIAGEFEGYSDSYAAAFKRKGERGDNIYCVNHSNLIALTPEEVKEKELTFYAVVEHYSSWCTYVTYAKSSVEVNERALHGDGEGDEEQLHHNKEFISDQTQILKIKNGEWRDDV